MRTVRALPFALGALLLCAAVAPRAMASEWNRKTIVTFDEPVQIPGKVLSPGTYVFKLANTSATRNIVQIWNKDLTHIYATLSTNDDYTARTPGHDHFILDKNRPGSPLVLQSWFYPGENVGLQFEYFKSQP